MRKEITSTQNTYIKELVQLKDKSRLRKKTQTFLIEGLREISLAILGEYRIETILVNTSIISEVVLQDLLNKASSTIEVIEISKDVYKNWR